MNSAEANAPDRTAIYWTVGKPQRVCSMSDGQLEHKLKILEHKLKILEQEAASCYAHRSGQKLDLPPIYYTIRRETAQRADGTVSRSK